LKVKRILTALIIFLSLFATGCTNNRVEVTEERNQDAEVIHAVLDYMEQEDWTPEYYTIDKWKKASVKKIIADERYKNIEKSYIGKEIFTVTIDDALAAPTVFVDPTTLTVIGIMPGE